MSVGLLLRYLKCYSSSFDYLHKTNLLQHAYNFFIYRLIMWIWDSLSGVPVNFRKAVPEWYIGDFQFKANVSLEGKRWIFCFSTLIVPIFIHYSIGEIICRILIAQIYLESLFIGYLFEIDFLEDFFFFVRYLIQWDMNFVHGTLWHDIVVQANHHAYIRIYKIPFGVSMGSRQSHDYDLIWYIHLFEYVIPDYRAISSHTFVKRSPLWAKFSAEPTQPNTSLYVRLWFFIRFVLSMQ